MRYRSRKRLVLPAIAVFVVLAGAVAAYFLFLPQIEAPPESGAEAGNAMTAADTALPQDFNSPQSEATVTEVPAREDAPVTLQLPETTNLPESKEPHAGIEPPASTESNASTEHPASTAPHATTGLPVPVEDHAAMTPDAHKGGTETKHSTPGSAIPASREIPEVLAPYYEKAPDGASYFNLPENTAQLVVVDDADGVIRALFFEKYAGDNWLEVQEFSTQAWGGSNGIRPKQREGDRVTPVGQFPILEAFYIDKKPETKLDTFRITNETYWVDDPGSVFYNTRVEGTGSKDWNSAEHMISYPGSYKYGFVIGYNLDCVPGLGSAVFFHIAQRNTIGCVGVSEEACLKYLAMLDKSKTPYILIVSTKGN